MFVKEVKAELIKNSRGERTVQIILKTYEGKFVSSAPSGKSKGDHEVLAYNKKGIDYSLRLFKILAKKLQHNNFLIKQIGDLSLLVKEIKMFEDKHGRLGGNFTYALESAFLKAAAKEKKKELWQFISGSKKPKIPMPVGNCIGGGMHSTGKKQDFQEFLLIPNEKTFSKAVTKNVRAYERAKELIRKAEKSWKIKTNDESALASSLTNEEVLEILFQLGKKFKLKIGSDMAASTFYSNTGHYKYKNKELIRDGGEQIEYVCRLIEKYNLFYVEDPLNQEDFAGFAAILKNIKKGKKTFPLIVGDDLTVTKLLRTRRAEKSKAINSMIIKPNQIGSLLEVKKVVDFCKANDIKIIFSHRSGETMDDALGDFAVGFGADFIKTGIYGKERLIKLKRIMDIERSAK